MTTIVQSALTLGDLADYWSRGDFVGFNVKHGERLRALFDEENWKQDPIGQALGLVGQFFDPISTLAGTADNLVKTIEMAADLPQSIYGAVESSLRVARQEAEFKAKVEPRILNQMELASQERARRSADQTRAVIRGIEERIKSEQALRQSLLEQRKSLVFTGSISSEIASLDISLAARQQALDRNRRALEMAQQGK